MSARTRLILTAVSVVWIATVAVMFGRVPLATFNILLATLFVPLVTLIGVFARWSAHQHANRWARDIAKVHGRQLSREQVSR